MTSNSDLGGMRLDWFDRKIVDFVLAWAPYDGPTDDETFPEFGMGVAELTSRFVEIIAMQTLFRHATDSADYALLQRAQAHAYYLHITHQPPPDLPPTAEARPLHPVPLRRRSPSRSLSTAITSEGS